MMSVLTLVQQNPSLIWLGVGVLFVLAGLLTGFGRLIWPGLAAGVIAALGLMGVRLETGWALGAFVAVALFGWLAPRRLSNGHSAYVAGMDDGEERPKAKKAAKRSPGTVDRTDNLVGRIGKTTGAFSNGVGRVWIEGAEWGADLEQAEFLSPGTPVRVTGVTGGVRLRVRAISH